MHLGHTADDRTGRITNSGEGGNVASIRHAHGWTIVVPIRDPHTGKTRLGAGVDINLAIAQDTLAAALDCTLVCRVIVVTDEQGWVSAKLRGTRRLDFVPQHSRGLAGAIDEGIAHAGDGAVAVMLGDLPALSPGTLQRALSAASFVQRGMVSDHTGSGTTLITARKAADHRPCFGPGSAGLHRDLGYEELPIGADSALRRDVDTPDDLDAVLRLGVGPATRDVLALAGAVGS